MHCASCLYMHLAKKDTISFQFLANNSRPCFVFYINGYGILCYFELKQLLLPVYNKHVTYKPNIVWYFGIQYCTLYCSCIILCDRPEICI